MNSARCGVFLSFLLCVASWCGAEPVGDRKGSIRIQGRADVIVTDSAIKLADIAQIDSASVRDDDMIIRLRTIPLGTSPRAGESVMLEGMKILEKLRDEGIRLDSILYSFPRQIKVTRAFREVTAEELERALRSFLSQRDREIDLKQIVLDRSVKIPTDSFGVEVVGLKSMHPGHFGVDYRSVAGSDEVRFQMRAVADEWRLMPVAVKPLKRGVTVSGADVQLTRVNGTAVGRDSIEHIGDIVGRSLARDVGQGEMFQGNAVVTPPVIEAGNRVSMIFRRGRLEASALGVALESGVVGQEIKVRNEASQKVVPARVVEKGMVEVGAR